MLIAEAERPSFPIVNRFEPTREFDELTSLATEWMINLTRQSIDFSNVSRSPRLAGNEDAPRLPFKISADRNESDLEHSFNLEHVAPVVMPLLCPKIDCDFLQKYAHVHDLPEQRTKQGDVNTLTATDEEMRQKSVDEHAACEELKEILDEPWRSALIEYEALTSKDEQERQAARELYGDEKYLAAMSVCMLDKLLPEINTFIYLEQVPMSVFLDHRRSEYGIYDRNTYAWLLEKAFHNFRHRFGGVMSEFEDLRLLESALDYLQWITISAIRTRGFDNQPVLF